MVLPEEKGSDVNLATELLVDGFKRRFDMAAVVTNDADWPDRSGWWSTT